jgi:hypothetical protein
MFKSKFMKIAFVLLASSGLITIGVLIRTGAIFYISEHSYVGVQACRPCHSTTVRGNQHEIWSRSKHALAYLDLAGEKAKSYAKAHTMQNPQADSQCVMCHSTGFGTDRSLFQASFRFEDGVQCEACHGPGSDYGKFSVMKDRSKFIGQGGIIDSESMCLKCHVADVSDKKLPKCPFQTRNFVFKAEFEKIKHPVPHQ